MDWSEYAAVLVFTAVVLFGIVDTIRTPLVIKRFYRNRGFTDHGKKTLSDITAARIVDGMYTEKSLHNSATGISQFKSWSVDRRKFTLGKAARKRNRAPWSVTIVDGDFTKLSCLILPTVVPEAITYVGNGLNMNFEDDIEIANRYHITAADEAMVRSIMVGEVREFLLKPDAIYIESTDTQLVIKRNWADHQVLDRLERELVVAESLRGLLAA